MMTHRKVRLFGYAVHKIGIGEFGIIYCGITDQDAVDFLLQAQHGEVSSALEHSVLGKIDLIWGRETIGKKLGYGLAKIAQKHPEALVSLAQQISSAKIIEELPARRILIAENNGQRSIIDLQWFDKKKIWLVNSYIPLNDQSPQNGG